MQTILRWMLVSVVLFVGAVTQVRADRTADLRARAEAGAADAQYDLGFLYDNGYGVAQDYQAALTWYRKAAEKGVADASYRLGALYERGKGVPSDMEYAYGWYSVAAHVGNAKGADALKKVAAKLSETERTEAKKLSRDLIKKYGVVPKSTSRRK